MSGFPDELMAQEGLTPVVPILRKPFPPKKLLQAIQQTLSDLLPERTVGTLAESMLAFAESPGAQRRPPQPLQ
jgi:hypothetical protein